VQVAHASQLAAFCVVLYLPASQATHCRLVVVVGATVCLLPGWQIVNAVHVLSEVAVAAVDSYWLELQTVSDRHWPFALYLPAPQAEQTRSEVLLGATLSVSPVLHSDHG